ncbi:protein kinase C-binding protein 1 isoform X3 [Myripristis murdjan]|nr:protein kinase C-binding protein 1-like isoform X3 [Myripristis murdjan]
MEISTRSKVSDQGSAERVAQKRKMPSPSHSSNGHSSAETSPSPMKKKKKPGAVSSSKDQSELRHGPFYYVKQPALTTDPVDVIPQDGRNDFYCWLCHREGQVLCCELCPRVYHAKCLKLPAEPEGDWFCPECEKITVAECIETQSKAMMMLTIDQLSYLLKFALQKMKQPGDHPRSSSHSPHAASTQRKTFNWTEPFQKPVSLEQHPDYAEYIFHPMDLCTLEKNIKKKMYGCTEAFLADAKWILHNCIIYNGGNHKLTATAKVIVKICEHEMNEIEVCPECYLSACQKRDNWFCEPCSNPHPLVWAKLKGFPFWPAKALRDKDGQVDARFFGQHDRAWVPLNNCYLMSKEIPFSVKKTKSIFNSAMQEMEVYVENMRKRFGVFNYAPFRTPYTPDNQFQMLLDPSNPLSSSVKPEKQEKIKLSFDMTASPKMPLGRSLVSGAGVGGSTTGRRIPLSDMPRSPMSTNSSAHTGSDGEQETADKSQTKAPNSQYSTGEESMDCTASPAYTRPGPAGSTLDSPKPFHSQAPGLPLIPKQEKTPPTGSILNLNLDRSKAEMDLKELSETVQQKQGATQVLTSPKRQIKSRFQLNLDKTIESCKAQLGIDEISEDVYKGVEHSDSEDSDKSDSSDSEYASDEEQKPKDGQDAATNDKGQKESSKPVVKDQPSSSQDKEGKPDVPVTSKSAAGDAAAATVEKEKASTDSDRENPEKTKAAPASPVLKEKAQVKDEVRQPMLVEDSDSERELVIDLGEEQGGKERKRGRRDTSTVKEPTAGKPEGKATALTAPSQNSTAPSSASSLSSQSPVAIPVTMVSFSTASPVAISPSTLSSATPTSTPTPASSSASTTPALKKQRPLLPRETVPVVQRAVVWNPTGKFQTSSQKWHMQKVQRQQQNQQTLATTQLQATSPGQGQAQALAQAQPSGNISTSVSSSSTQQSSQSTRYQTRQAVKAVQQKDTPLSASTSAATLASSSPASVALMAASTLGAPSSSSPLAVDLQIPTASADVAADIAKYTNKIMDAIKGTMTEIYNDLSKSTSGNTIAEIRRLRIEIEKLQWLHQQELSEMKHNLELTMAEMRQSLEQERERLVAEVKKQMELEKQQAVDETKKKQWCANCRKEAIFYCCWNTSYCDYPCQQAHWPEHMKSCTQSATAPQQEPETESTADLPNKGLGQSSSGPVPLRDTMASTPSDKDCEMEKSTENVAVSLS